MINTAPPASNSVFRQNFTRKYFKYIINNFATERCRSGQEPTFRARDGSGTTLV